jgi:hypothetical protein
MTDMNLENVSGKSWVITYLLKNSFKKFNKIRTGEFRNKEYMEVRPVFGDLNIKFVEKSKVIQ